MQRTKKERLLGFMLGLAAVTAVTVVAGLVWAGDLEPSAAPAPTFKTLDEIPGTWSRVLPADDGEPDGCNSSRFDCVMDGAAVLDKETGLVWQRDASSSLYQWNTAVLSCLVDNDGSRRGWRVPLAHELESLVDPNNLGGNPDLPPGHPFLNMGPIFYWSANSVPGAPASAWGVNFGVVSFLSSNLMSAQKTSFNAVLCVRGGTNAVQY